MSNISTWGLCRVIKDLVSGEHGRSQHTNEQGKCHQAANQAGGGAILKLEKKKFKHLEY
jgi:hypothetical protein